MQYCTPYNVKSGTAQKVINLSSDTATEPSEEMKAFAFAAECGNMGHEGCSAVESLQRKAAEIFGAEDALWTFGGTRSNQIALSLHAPAGTKAFCAATSHIDTFAEGVFASRPIKIEAVQADGPITENILEDVLASQMDRDYAAPASAIVLENTMGYHGGAVYPFGDIKAVSQLAHSKDMKVHIDGARILNAFIAGETPLTSYMQCADTMSVCLAKGLGAPQGSILLGSKETIADARTVQRKLGDNLYGVGWYAAAGLYALEHNITLLAEDHDKARQFQETLSAGEGVDFMHDKPPTNMVLFNVSALGGLSGDKGNKAEQFTQRLKEDRGVKLYALPKGWVRAVAHQSVTAEQTQQAAQETLEMINRLG